MRFFLFLLVASGFLTGCATSPVSRPIQSESDRFFQSVSKLCGKAFAGRMVTDHPNDADLKGKAMIMHVQSCTADTIKIPLHVENDRSRTWVITKQMAADGKRLVLKHDHRHQDGSEDEITQYGGQAVAAGSTTRQEFPADDFSKALFERTGATKFVAEYLGH